MAKQIIKLTEQDLHDIIRTAVNKVIKEGFGDWRDDYDAYMGYYGKDKDKQKELRQKYDDSVKAEFGDDEKARIKALNKHMDSRDSLRDNMLNKSQKGRDYLDWESAWNSKYNAEHGIGDEGIGEADLDSLIAKAAQKRERGAMRTKPKAVPQAEPQKPTRSPEEIEAQMRAMGLAK